MKDVIAKILKKSKLVKLKEEELLPLIETPPSPEMGDYAFPCFALAKILKQNPHDLALQVRQEIGNPPAGFESIETSGPYINFFVDRKSLAMALLDQIKKQKNSYGKSKIGKGKKILVEFSSPNIAKPFGIGHLRSTIIGNSIANICEAQGFKVTRMNYLGDWGTQFGKLIVGYKKWGNDKKLKKDPIKHLFDLYVRANKKEYESDARVFFKSLEDGDKASIKLWKKFRDLSLKEFDKIYKSMGIKFNVYSGESMYEKKMKLVVEDLKKKKLLKKSQGAFIVNLKSENLGVVLIQKTDGATLYATRDLAAAIERQKKYKFDRMIYEAGQEQKLHFKQFFKVLEMLGYKWAENLTHAEHGLYLDKDGKKFATRKGKTIFMEDVIEDTVSLARKEVKKRFPKLGKTALDKRAKSIALAAIFYGDLKNVRSKDMIFDIKRFVSFEGNTGPYIQYSYARASSILRKLKSPKKQIIIKNLEDKEIALVKKLEEFPKVAEQAYNGLMPSGIANYSYQLAQIFNEFYAACPVLKSEQEAFRIALVESFRQVLKNAFSLLGIEVLEKM